MPVLVYEGSPPPDTFTTWASSVGAIIINHNLTIRPQLIRAAQSPFASHTRSLWGSYLRIEPHLVMDKVLDWIVQAYGAKGLRAIDTNFVLWTDPDVFFFSNITSCSIPKPHIMSIGPEALKDGTGNCGVIYYNIRAYRCGTGTKPIAMHIPDVCCGQAISMRLC